MRFLVLGVAGMLGTDVAAELRKRGHELVGLDVAELDITDPVAVARIGAGEVGKFDWCINCAAYTAVDKAESEADAAMLLNGIAPGYIATSCRMADIRLLHVSTDFVFNGTASEPYKEEEPTDPIGAYGRSKRNGEEAVQANDPSALIVRTAWLYGPNGNSFPKTMIRAFLAGRQLRVVSDQKGSPTYTADLARVLVDLSEKAPEGGIYHATGPDIVSWHRFAIDAIEAYQREVQHEVPHVEIEPIRTEEYPTPARRPSYSALSFEKVQALGIEPMRHLREALADFVCRLQL